MDATLIGVAARALALGAAGLRLAQTVIVKKDGNGNRQQKSGKVSPEVWKADIRKIIQEENEDVMADIRLLLDARIGAIRRELTDPILSDLKETRNSLRTALTEAIAQAAALGRGRRN